MKIKVERPNGIYAEIIQHSKAKDSGKEVLTVAVKYGLIVHSEFLRHRMLSRGVKSNRAIPAKVIRKEVLEDPYIPVFLGRNKPGMQSTLEIRYRWLGKAIWCLSRYPAVFAHWLLEKIGAHKEWANRLLNPWQWVRETITATDWQNVFALRDHPAAQRDVREVVVCIKEALELSREKKAYTELSPGEWHTPYIVQFRDEKGHLHYMDNDREEISVEEALTCSAARCARSSYDKHDGGMSLYADDKKLFDTLLSDDPKHCSPVEHMATPISSQTLPFEPDDWEKGITHVDAEGNLYSGNLCGFIQYRQMIEGHTKKG